MFSVFYINFDYSSPQQFEDMDAAISYARSKGFEAAIYMDDLLVASWSPIGGKKIYQRFSEVSNVVD